METCSRESIFKRYYSPHFVFTKPEYLSDESLDNFELREILDNARNVYNKSPKKENRHPIANSTLVKTEKSKRGSYNFINQNPAAAALGPSIATFITRDQMQKVPEKRRKKSLEEKNMVWMLPK